MMFPDICDITPSTFTHYDMWMTKVNDEMSRKAKGEIMRLPAVKVIHPAHTYAHRHDCYGMTDMES